MADSSLQHQRNTGVYEIVNTVNGKRYVGSAVSFEQRWKLHRLHLRRGSHHSRHLQASWNRYGEERFLFQAILLCDRTNLLLYEQAAIDAFNPEFNVCRFAGSCLGLKHSPETKAKLSAAKIGNKATLGYKHRPESIEKMRAIHTGVPSPTKGQRRDASAVAATASAHRGMKRSDETRAKIAAKALGRKRTAESIEKGAAKLRGVPLSPEHAAKLIGNKHAAGYRHTDEWKAAASVRQTGVKRPKDAAYRAKISAALTGRKATPEHRANQSAAQLGKKRGPYKKSRIGEAEE